MNAVLKDKIMIIEYSIKIVLVNILLVFITFFVTFWLGGLLFWQELHCLKQIRPALNQFHDNNIPQNTALLLQRIKQCVT